MCSAIEVQLLSCTCAKKGVEIVEEYNLQKQKYYKKTFPVPGWINKKLTTDY